MMQKILLLPAFCLAMAFAPVANALQNPLGSRLSRIVEYRLMDSCVEAKIGEITHTDYRISLCACALKRASGKGIVGIGGINNKTYDKNPEKVLSSVIEKFGECRIAE